jgi:hypothetical protein
MPYHPQPSTSHCSSSAKRTTLLPFFALALRAIITPATAALAAAALNTGTFCQRVTRWENPPFRGGKSSKKNGPDMRKLMIDSSKIITKSRKYELVLMN